MSETTQKPHDYRLRLPALVAYREAQAKRLAADFCDAPEYVMGCEVHPVTPRTFSMLVASGNRFVCGGQVGEDDVIDFIWFHSPLYVRPGTNDGRSRKRRALSPYVLQMRPSWRWRLVHGTPLPQRERTLAVFVLAVGEIRTIVEETFACSSRGTPGPTLATLEAQMIDAMATGYRWPRDQTSNTPLRQLFQLARCLALNQGAEVRDEGERRILADHLAGRVEEMRRNGTLNPKAANG